MQAARGIASSLLVPQANAASRRIFSLNSTYLSQHIQYTRSLTTSTSTSSSSDVSARYSNIGGIHSTFQNSNTPAKSEITLEDIKSTTTKGTLTDSVSSFLLERLSKSNKDLEAVSTESQDELAYKTLASEVEEFLEKNETDNAYEVLVTMRRFELKPTKELYEKVLTTFATNKSVVKVKEVLQFMHRDGVYADEQSHMKVVRAYAGIRQYEWVKKAFLNMLETVKPSEAAYEEVIVFLYQDPHVANVRKAEEIFYTAHRFDVRPSSRTCYTFIKHLVNTGYEGDVDRAIEVMKFMKVKHISPNPHIVGVFRKHMATLIEGRQFIRMKKVLRGLQHGGFPDSQFKRFWDLVNAKKWINKVQRADLAPP